MKNTICKITSFLFISAGSSFFNAASAESSCSEFMLMDCVIYDDLPNYLQIESVEAMTKYGMPVISRVCNLLDPSGQCESRSSRAAMVINAEWVESRGSFIPKLYRLSSYDKDLVNQWDQ